MHNTFLIAAPSNNAIAPNQRPYFNTVSCAVSVEGLPMQKANFPNIMTLPSLVNLFSKPVGDKPVRENFVKTVSNFCPRL